MKHFSALLLAFLLGLSINAQAVTYCSSSAFGYGKNATGGGNASPVLVSSVSQLSSAMNKAKNKVIIITASLTFTSMLSVQDGANVTLMALPGVTLTSLQQNSTSSGILYVKRFDNLIIRNITFVGPGAYDCDGNDLLCFEKVTNAWVDHCDFQDGCDGNFDNKSLTDNVTVSWCRFRYLKQPKAGGSGGSDDHRYTNLLGSSSDDKPSDGTYNFTWAYCWWDNGCVERMVRCRNASLHFLNCYWNSSVANYYIGPQNADAYVEGCYIEGKPASNKIFYQNYGGTNGVKFVNSYAAKGLPSNVTNRTVVTPNYSYTALSYSEAKSAVTNSSCGAGATLTVTTSGAVSSSCDGGGGGQAAPTLTLTSGQANQTVDLGDPISNIVYTASGTANAISVANLPNGLTSSKNGLVLTISGSPTATGTYTVTATNSSGVTASLQGTITVNDGSGGSTGGGGSNNYIYYWQMSGTTAYANNSSHDALPSGCTLYAGTTDDSKTYSVESATYVDGVPSSMQAANGKGTKMVANAQYFKATLASGNFQAGDTIFVCGYNDWKISTTSSQTGDVIAALGTGSDKNSYQVGYTILSANTSELYFMRANGAGTGITAIKVCRPSSAPPAAPTLTLTSGQANQTVNSGSAISNIVYTASGTATSITVSGLPAGLTFSKNGLVLTISGTPTASGTYTVTAANSGGVTTTLQGTITVNGGGQQGGEGDALYYWQMSGTEAPANDAVLSALGGTLTIQSTDANKTFTVESAAYAASVPADMKAADGKGLKNGGNALHMVAQLTSGNFQAGDTIYICGYNPWKVSSTSAKTGDLVDSIATGTSKTDYQVGYAVLPSNATALYFSRKTGSGTCVSAIKVCRPSGGGNTPEESPDLDGSDNASQTVIEGNAITPIIFVASGTAVSISVSNLPAGLTYTINGLTLTISGTPTESGAYTVTATNSEGATVTDGGYITVEEAQIISGNTTDIVNTGTWWNISDDDFKALAGDITADIAVRQLHMIATSEKKMAIDANTKDIDTYHFTHRLKTSGVGAADNRHLWFDVKGDCTIDFYMMSASSSDRILDICTGVFGNVSATIPVLKGDSGIRKYTYNYTGNAAKILVFSDAGGGINFYGIKLSYPDDPVYANYTVKHWQQNLTGNEYTEVTADRQTLSGIVGETTAAEAKTYTGFTAQAITQQTIADGGGTIVNVYYNRNTYTIIWKNDDGTTLETDNNVRYGATPSYDGATPTKATTAQYTYTFSSWTPAIATVTTNAIYMAQFNSTLRSYTVTFQDNLGHTLKTQTVNYGSAATAPTIPNIDCYTHGSWDKAFNNITSDLTVTVTYTVDKHSVTIHYEATQGSVTIQ